MAIMKVCSVFDEKAEAFNPPMFVQALGMATRDFTDAFTNPESKMRQHKGDFKLYHVADFDTASGRFEGVEPPRLMANGSDIGD